MKRNIFLGSIIPCVFCIVSTFMPHVAGAQVANFSITTDARIVKPNLVSDPITVQSQNGGGEAMPVPQTTCLSLTTTSAQGQFSSNASNWNPVSVLTMNKNTSNRSFYYKDSAEGTYTITVKTALKPEEEDRSCTNWPVAEWGTTWTTTQNIIISTSAAPEEPEDSSPSETSSSPAAASGELIVEAGGDRFAIAGADMSFSAKAFRGKTELEVASFTWNFGDGSTAQGASVMHRFAYSGRYAVVVTGAKDGAMGSDRLTVTAEQAQFMLRILSDGGVEIENLATRDADLSRWIVRSAGQTFLIPEHTLVLGKQALRIAPETLHFYANTMTELHYPNGTLAFRAGEKAPELPTPPLAEEQAASLVAETIQEKNTSREVMDTRVTTIGTDAEEEGSLTDTYVATSSQTAAAGSTSGSWTWWLGAGALAAFAGAALYFAQRSKRKEWDIIEDPGS